MVLELANDHHSRERVALAFRTIRHAQRRRSLDVANAMNMPHRSYQAIEAGEGRPEFGDLEAFARATGVDPVALAIAVLCGAPELALACSDNQLMLIAALELADMVTALGPSATKLTPLQIIHAVRELERFLRRELGAIEGVQAWLDRRLGRSGPSDRPLEASAAS